MRIEILTLFPAYFESPLAESLLGKGIAREAPRGRRHRPADVLRGPAPQGGRRALRRRAGHGDDGARHRGGRRSPAGRDGRLERAADAGRRAPRPGRLEALARRDSLLLFCGRYEGLDERARQLGLFDEEISLGDFVLPGGEAAALALVEALSRLVPGVVGSAESVERESFARDRLDYPHYTRPREFRGLPVPEVLLSGDHARIERWRRARARSSARGSAARICSRSGRPPASRGTSDKEANGEGRKANAGS